MLLYGGYYYVCVDLGYCCRYVAGGLVKVGPRNGGRCSLLSCIRRIRLQSIAIIALAIVILDFLISVGFIFEPAPEIGFGMVANDGIAEPTINLNIGMLVFSAIMYSLSAIFRYAALLQQLSDETV